MGEANLQRKEQSGLALCGGGLRDMTVKAVATHRGQEETGNGPFTSTHKKKE